MLPLNKQHRAKYMLNHRVSIMNEPSDAGVLDFDSMAARELVLTGGRIVSKYFYNERKVQ